MGICQEYTFKTKDTCVSLKCYIFYPGDLFKHPLNSLLEDMKVQNTARCENFQHCQSNLFPPHPQIIVGAGSAGCVLASRLTEDPGERVLVLEAGPRDTVMGAKWPHWKIHMPAALTYNLCNDK